MRTAIAMVLALPLAACRPMSVEEEIESVLPEIYLQENVPQSDRDASLPEDLRAWKWDVLDPANFLTALQLRRDIVRRIRDIDARLEEYRLRGTRGPVGTSERMLEERMTLRMKFDLVQMHLPNAELPADEAEQLAQWRRTVLAASAPGTVQKLRQDSASRIKWLSAKIKELDESPPDVVWPDYSHYSLMLHFEIQKLNLMGRRA